MNIEELVDRFRDKPYMLEMGKNKLSTWLKSTTDDIKEAKKIARGNGKSQLEELCDVTNIPKENVNHYWYKGKHFSLHAKQPDIDPEEQFKTLLEECKKESQIVRMYESSKNKDSKCAIVNIYDIHLDKRNTLNPIDVKNQVETLNEEIFVGFGKLLHSILKDNPSQFILPVGNDLFTTNGFEKTTKKGTPQDPIAPHDYVFRWGLKAIRTMIDTLSQYGKVYVPMIYGNHDKDASFYLGLALEVLYEKNENVTIQNIREPRKYIQFQDNLFGFGHGDTEKRMIDKLPLIMATENPKMWGDTKYRTFMLGDLHHKIEYKFFRTKDHAGCEVKFLRSISVSDAWHIENGFIGIPRTMEATVFDANKGQIANYSINI